MTKKFWSTRSSDVVYETPVFSLRRLRKQRPHAPIKDHDFYIIDAADWVNVIPITAQGEVVFIEHYRHGTDEVSLEVPGGMMDPEDASPRVAAAREMLEETGYDASELIELGMVHPNPALQPNRCFTYLAKDAFRAAPPRPEDTEDISVVTYPRSEVEELLQSGRITHALVVAAFAWLFDYEKNGK